MQGETQQKLDVLANQTLLALPGQPRQRRHPGLGRKRGADRRAQQIRSTASTSWSSIRSDGSSNIDVNVSVGTIFSILRRDDDAPPGRDPLADVLQPGSQQVAAGYVVYGSSTMLVYSTGNGVHGFTLDPAIGAYVLSTRTFACPSRGRTTRSTKPTPTAFRRPIATFLADLRERPHGRHRTRRATSARWWPIFTARCSRAACSCIRRRGNYPDGKLRLLYEANPIAFLAEQAGGMATDGRRRILDIVPTSIAPAHAADRGQPARGVAVAGGDRGGDVVFGTRCVCSDPIHRVRSFQSRHRSRRTR